MRRARKGFELKYNPDRHWSGALYKSLNFIQYTDWSDITSINRDDASGFRLDTLTTHGKHATPAVTSRNILTTHTDYVNNPCYKLHLTISQLRPQLRKCVLALLRLRKFILKILLSTLLTTKCFHCNQNITPFSTIQAQGVPRDLNAYVWMEQQTKVLAMMK